MILILVSRQPSLIISILTQPSTQILVCIGRIILYRPAKEDQVQRSSRFCQQYPCVYHVFQQSKYRYPFQRRALERRLLEGTELSDDHDIRSLLHLLSYPSKGVDASGSASSASPISATSIPKVGSKLISIVFAYETFAFTVCDHYFSFFHVYHCTKLSHNHCTPVSQHLWHKNFSGSQAPLTMPNFIDRWIYVQYFERLLIRLSNFSVFARLDPFTGSLDLWTLFRIIFSKKSKQGKHKARTRKMCPLPKAYRPEPGHHEHYGSGGSKRRRPARPSEPPLIPSS